MSDQVNGTIEFIDGTSLKLVWGRAEVGDPATFMSRVKKAVEKDRFMFEIGGDLMIIPVQSIKHIRLSPSPQAMPKDMMIPGASIIS